MALLSDQLTYKVVSLIAIKKFKAYKMQYHCMLFFYTFAPHEVHYCHIPIFLFPPGGFYAEFGYP